MSESDYDQAEAELPGYPARQHERLSERELGSGDARG